MLATSAVCGYLLVDAPRLAARRGCPSLTLSPRAVREQLERDRAALAALPAEADRATFRRLWLAQGAAELSTTDSPAAAAERARERREFFEALRRRGGERALDALRASVAEELDDAVDGTMGGEDARHFVGSFLRVGRRYGVFAGDEVRAPWLTVRALFKGRFNVLAAIPPTTGLSPIELQAYWGWLALHGGSAPPQQRAEAALAYAAAGGPSGAEARACVLALAGDVIGAVRAYDRAFAETGNIRFRNLSTALQLGAP